MTRIGIISDIHADLDGLNLALEFLEDQEVDEIWCAGDLVDRGENGNEVVKRIRYAQIPTVQGNHDYIARRTQERLKNDVSMMEFLDEYPDLPESTKNMMIGSELSEINLTYLDYLPPARKFERSDLLIEMTHANTFDRVTYIYPSSRRELMHQTIDASIADLVILGHTHSPMKVYRNDKLRIINSGSVYMNYGVPKQSCGILTLPEREFTVYDITSKQAVPVPIIRLENDHDKDRPE